MPQPTTVIHIRMETAKLEELDKIRNDIQRDWGFRPTRTNLISVAVQDYINNAIHSAAESTEGEGR